MFLICGEAVIDLFQDSSSPQLAFKAQAAGSPFNVAVGLARLGCATSFMTGLSRDGFGDALIAQLDGEGVDWQLCPRTLHPTILSFVLLQADGTPDYAFYGSNGADFQVMEADLPLPLPAHIRAVHAGGFPTAIEPSKQAYARLLKAAAQDRFVSFDPNIRARLMGDLQIYRVHLEQLLPSLDLIKASVEDIAALYPDHENSAHTTAAVALRWLALGASCVIVTDAERGAAAYGHFGNVMKPAGRIAVQNTGGDTVGAGDSFMSAVLAHLVKQNILVRGGLKSISQSQMGDALVFANTAAAITCTRRGANPPRLSELGLP